MNDQEAKTLWVLKYDTVLPVEAIPLGHTFTYLDARRNAPNTASVWYAPKPGGPGELYSLGIDAFETETAALEIHLSDLRREQETHLVALQAVEERLVPALKRAKEVTSHE